MAASTYQTFALSPVRDSKHAVRLTVFNPPINLLNGALLTDLHAYLEVLRTQPEEAPKVVVISSNDPDFWIGHLDLHIVSVQYPLARPEEAGHFLHLLGGILNLFLTLPTVFIAEVNGAAVGGGNEFAVNMDMRFAGPRARFGVPEVGGGIVHGGGIQQLVKLIGPGRAMQMMLSSQGVLGEEAKRLGLVNGFTEDEKHLREFVDDLAVRIASFPRGGLQGTKASIRACLDGSGSMGADMKKLGELAHTQEAQRAISAFIEKGEDQTKSTWELRLPDSVVEIWES
ncbi:hypothetical protein BAUCODRAFT_146605 [Baudoinia panamericana UAMH 10762]|uniref:Enoyl-CoA hydratase n=1 Tax=Baudoinia panamericana (strain UAMH 10762) TaxID=717646 RepID=M2LU13_BAUPA|nr:uncharacterized protein BAUCODRAFT_146605 [Baudoinia panamericana UAMH 10762]EMC98012.1 hypothetical protein BAUCODRAFT_146605 [Baudoinia panamericana UAMH 10762]